MEETQETVESLQAEVTKSPFDTKLLFRLASALHIAKDYATAVRILERILRFERKSAPVLALLGECYFLLDQDEKSCQAFEEALVFSSTGRAPLQLKLGLLYTKHEDFRQGAIMLEHAITINDQVKNMYKARLAFGKCQEALKDLPNAITTYHQAFELTNTPIEKALCLAFIARCYAKSMQRTLCLSTLGEAERLVPGCSTLMKFWAWCYYTLSDLPAAKTYILKAFETLQGSEEDKVDLEFILGCCLVKAGEPMEAYTYLTSAATKQPSSALVWTAFGVAYAFRQQTQEAHQCTMRSLSLNPRNPEALGNLAAIYHMTGQKHLAKIAFNKAKELLPQLSFSTALTLPMFEVDTENFLTRPCQISLKSPASPFTLDITSFPTPLKLSIPTNRGKTPNSSPAPSPNKRLQVSILPQHLPAVSPERQSAACRLPRFQFVDIDLEELVDSSESREKKS